MPITEVKEKPTLYVVAAVLMNKNQILVTQRPKGKSMEGLWEFPGGKIEQGEQPEKALIRELKEELGITCQLEDLEAMSFVSYPYEKFHLFMPLWLVRNWSGKLQAIEHQDMRWITPDQLDQLPMPPADRPLIAVIQNYFLMQNEKDKIHEKP